MNRQANLSQALHLINGDTLTQKIAQGKLVPRLVAEKAPPEAVIEELYVLALCRKPTEAESKRLAEIVRRELDPTRLQEIFKTPAGALDTATALEKRLRQLKDSSVKLPKGGKAEAALMKAIKAVEQQQADAANRLWGRVAQQVYGDILWGLFNSSEFTFNH